MSGKPKGEATITYDDANAAQSAIEWFGGTHLFSVRVGKLINVQVVCFGTNLGYKQSSCELGMY